VFENAAIEVGGDAGVEGEVGAGEDVEVVHMFYRVIPKEFDDEGSPRDLYVIPQQKAALSNMHTNRTIFRMPVQHRSPNRF